MLMRPEKRVEGRYLASLAREGVGEATWRGVDRGKKGVGVHQRPQQAVPKIPSPLNALKKGGNFQSTCTL